VVNVLEEASEKNTPIMVFVGNRGIIQIHTGNVKKTLWHQQWFNVMDPDFNLTPGCYQNCRSMDR
jgi:putative hemin transport protein